MKITFDDGKEKHIYDGLTWETYDKFFEYFKKENSKMKERMDDLDADED